MNQLTVASHNHKIQLWLSRIKECRSSNQTVAEWCSEHDVSIKTYYYWMRKIKSEAFEALPAERKSKMLSHAPNPSFAQVPLSPKSKPDTCAIKLQVGDLSLEIQNGADSQTVEHTLRAIRKLC